MPFERDPFRGQAVFPFRDDDLGFGNEDDFGPVVGAEPVFTVPIHDKREQALEMNESERNGRVGKRHPIILPRSRYTKNTGWGTILPRPLRCNPVRERIRASSR